jgi:hypothetical protein
MRHCCVRHCSIDVRNYLVHVVINTRHHGIKLWKTGQLELWTHIFLRNDFLIHKQKSNKMQQFIQILLFHIYVKLNMFRATHRPSSGA